MKRLLILGTCAVLLLVQLFSGVIAVNAATGADIILKNYVISKNAVYENNDFKLTMNWDNNSSENLSDVIIEIDSSSSFYGTSTNTVKVNDIPASAAAVPVDLYLTYKGLGKDLKLNVRYMKGSPAVQYEESINLTIKNAIPTDNSVSVPVPVDTSKFAPRLSVSSGSSALIASAGVSNTITLPVSNLGAYAAKSVVVTLEMEDKSQAAKVMDSFNLSQNIAQILPAETKNASFNLKLLASAPEGVYAFKVNYSFLNFANDNFNSSETIYIKVVNNNTIPRLTVDNISTVPAVAVPGENVSVKVRVSNLGSLAAKDVKVVLKGLKNNGFITSNSTDVKYITKIEGNSSAEVTYTLKATTGIPSGSNELLVRIEYINATGDSVPVVEENQIFIPVSRTGAGKGLIIQNVLAPQSAVTVNKDFKLAFSLTNNGLTDISDIKITLGNDKEIVCKSMNSIMVDTLVKGETRKFEFTLFASQDAITRNYPVAINVEYGEPQGETTAKASISQYVGIYVENNGSGKSVPRIIIDKYSYEPEEIKAGDEFTLKMSYLNTSRSVNISNIKVTVSSDDGTFTPVNSSNTFFIDDLTSKKNIEKVLVLKAKPGSEAKAYALSINFDYEDDKGNQYNTKETISIPVLQAPRLVTGDIVMQPEAYTQQPFPVSIEFYNMGKVTLYNLLVKAEGDFTAQNGRYFVGNFDSGRSDSFEVQVTPNAAGEMKGNIVFSFEDAAGKIIEVKKDFAVNVMEMPVMDPSAGMEGLGPDGKPINTGAAKDFNILYVAVPAGILVLAAVTFFIIRKKRIRRRELSLDE